jgi:hypothetical protein
MKRQCSGAPREVPALLHPGKLAGDDDHDHHHFLAPSALVLVRRPIEQVNPCQAGRVSVLLQ